MQAMPRSDQDRTSAAALAAAAALHAAFVAGVLLTTALPPPPRERPVPVAVLVTPSPDTLLAAPSLDPGPLGPLAPKPRPARLRDEPDATTPALLLGAEDRCRPGPDGVRPPGCPERWARPDGSGDGLLHDDADRVLSPGFAGRSLAEVAAARGWIAPPRRVLREFAHRDQTAIRDRTADVIGASPIPPATETRALPAFR